jgi:hypothetical protein
MKSAPLESHGPSDDRSQDFTFRWFRETPRQASVSAGLKAALFPGSEIS